MQINIQGINLVIFMALGVFPTNVWGTTTAAFIGQASIRNAHGHTTEQQQRRRQSSVARHAFSYLGNDNVNTASTSVAPNIGQSGQQGIAAGVAAGRSPNTVMQTPETIVQGNSLRTWTFADPTIERVQVFLRTDGRPLNSNIELWHGPDNTPQKISVYVEDGKLRPFNAIIETPRGHNAVAVRNTGNLEFPLSASLAADNDVGPVWQKKKSQGQVVQGGAIRTYPFAPAVNKVQILMETDGRPLNARIELLQGPNNKKQVMEVYCEDGLERPFYCILETPGAGNVIRIVNTATLEYPLTATVEPYGLEGDDSGKMTFAAGSANNNNNNFFASY